MLSGNEKTRMKNLAKRGLSYQEMAQDLWYERYYFLIAVLRKEIEAYIKEEKQ